MLSAIKFGTFYKIEPKPNDDENLLKLKLLISLHPEHITAIIGEAMLVQDESMNTHTGNESMVVILENGVYGATGIDAFGVIGNIETEAQTANITSGMAIGKLVEDIFIRNVERQGDKLEALPKIGISIRHDD